MWFPSRPAQGLKALIVPLVVGNVGVEGPTGWNGDPKRQRLSVRSSGEHFPGGNQINVGVARHRDLVSKLRGKILETTQEINGQREAICLRRSDIDARRIVEWPQISRYGRGADNESVKCAVTTRSAAVLASFDTQDHAVVERCLIHE